MELLDFSLELNTNQGLFTWARLYFKGPEFDVTLNSLVGELAADEAFGVKDSISGISCGLILCSITDEALVFSEGDIGRGSVEALIISNDFDFIILPHTYTGVGCAEIDTN